MDYLQLRELYHSGVKGMKWGIRRYQNEDGTLTAEGKVRYGANSAGQLNKQGRDLLNRDIELESYRSKLLAPRETEIESLKRSYDAKLKVYDSKINTAKDNGKDSKAQKLVKKRDILKAERDYELGWRFTERDNIRDMSLDDLHRQYMFNKTSKIASFLQFVVPDEDSSNAMFWYSQIGKRQAQNYYRDKDDVRSKKQEYSSKVKEARANYKINKAEASSKKKQESKNSAKHSDIYTEELYHAGVKGMKWGVRHEREYESVGRKPRKQSFDNAKNKVQNSKASGEKVHHLSGKAKAWIGIGTAAIAALGIATAIGYKKSSNAEKQADINLQDALKKKAEFEKYYANMMADIAKNSIRK